MSATAIAYSIACIARIDGYGGLLATPNTTTDDPELAELLKTMSAFATKPLVSFDPTWYFELGGVVEQPAAPVASAPAKMAKIPGGKYRFVGQGSEVSGKHLCLILRATLHAISQQESVLTVSFIVTLQIEGAGSNYNDIGRGVDVQHSWELRPDRFHSQYLWVTPYYIDLAPVTQGDFADYLKKEGTKAVSTDRYHYLVSNIICRLNLLLFHS